MELTITEIKAQYPDQWVLIGNPQLSTATLTSGVVIWHGKNKLDLIKTEVDWRSKYDSAMTFFTGERPKNKRFLL